MRLIQIKHSTRYRYSEPVTLLPHTLLVRPREGHDIRVRSSTLEITPDFQTHWKRDIYGNSVAVVDFLQPSSELLIVSHIVVEHYEEQIIAFSPEEYSAQGPFEYDPALSVDLLPYQTPNYPEDQIALTEWVSDVIKPGLPINTLENLSYLNQKIANELQYSMREEPGVQSPAETLLKGGSCRDFATLFNETCRSWGLATRFVSGYVFNANMPEGHRSTHAWSEVFMPGSGWRGFDPTSGLIVSGNHIATAVHRHPEFVPPVSGSFIGSGVAETELVVDVLVEPVMA